MATLQEMAASLAQIEEFLKDVEADQEICDQAVGMWLESEDGMAVQEKLSNMAGWVSELECTAKARKDYANSILEASKAIANKATSIKAYMLGFMQYHGITKAVGQRHTVSVSNNGGKLPLVIPADIDVTKMPVEFQQVTVTLNRDAVEAALAEDPDALSLYGIYTGERGQHIRIK